MGWALDTTTVVGGNATEPVDVPGIVRAVAAGHERMSALQQGKNQLLLLQPVQIGDGGSNPTRLNLSTAAIEFPQQYNVASGQVFYCSADNVAGMTFYPGSSDYFDLSSSVWSSASKFHWGFHASSSASSTVLTSGMQVIGAGTVTLNANIPLTGVSFYLSDQITAAGNTVTGCTFSSSVATATQGAISITGSTQSALQTALDKFVGCYFTNNTVSGAALKIIYTGTASAINLTMTGNTFSGNTKDIYWEAPASSPLTISKTAGANPSTYTATNSNTVTFSAAYTLTLTNLITGTQVTITNASTDAELQNTTVGGTGIVTYVHGGGTTVNILVVHLNYDPNVSSIYDLLLPNSDSSIKFSQLDDNNYSNPV
jgi:hypothetical protein